MSSLSVELLLKASRTVRQHRGEADDDYIARLTHIAIENKLITNLNNINKCRSMMVLYAYDNVITKIDSLNYCNRLTNLYLQHNNISRLENLQGLTVLSKLYIGHNAIAVVEGLETLVNLRELHVENQHLAPGDALTFDPRTLRALSSSLSVLNISYNHMEDIRDLALLTSLTQLNISANSLDNLDHLSMILLYNPGMWRLWVTGNIICSIPKYREEIIIRGMSLTVIDGFEITDTARQFLVNWKSILDKKRAPSSAPLPPSPKHPVPYSTPLYPSKFSNSNPNWLPPLRKKSHRSSSSKSKGEAWDSVAPPVPFIRTSNALPSIKHKT